jgi:mannose-1-phosphate guanylyltransferase / mannose-6-phosphate isomerase
MPNISIDYGILEKIAAERKQLLVIPCDIQWDDVGSWDAIHQISAKDNAGNVIQGNVLALDCKNSLLKSNHRLVAAVGVDDICLIETADAILISKRGETQRVKEIVDELHKLNIQEGRLHLTVTRPWGKYTVLENQAGFKIKRIVVNPGASLSLQSHQHRSEHWVVVSGTATVTCYDKTVIVTKNQSTYIPVGEKHRLENRGKIPVHLIEVQVGEYVEEDDIERFDDFYNRS